MAIGLTFVSAWFVERGGRFGAAGATLSGLGVGLVIAGHITGFAAYREELAFCGIGLGFLVAALMAPSRLRGAGLGLLAVAISEAALHALPTVVSATSLYKAFIEGWGFGVVLAACGVFAILTPRLYHTASVP